MKKHPDLPKNEVLDRFETAAGRDIPNYQEQTVMDYGDMISRRQRYTRLYREGAASERTTTPTGIYNCHGFVFASARTGIDGRDVRMILHDDGYTRVDNPEDTQPGDVVLYVGSRGDVEHSGILVKPARESLSSFAVIVSKWGNFTEWVHDLLACPYDASQVEYWRITQRPRKPQPAPCLIQP